MCSLFSIGYEVKTSKFDWKDYLTFCNAIPAPTELFHMVINLNFSFIHELEIITSYLKYLICFIIFNKCTVMDKKKHDTRCYSDTYHCREMKLVPFFIAKCPL